MLDANELMYENAKRLKLDLTPVEISHMLEEQYGVKPPEGYDDALFRAATSSEDANANVNKKTLPVLKFSDLLEIAKMVNVCKNWFEEPDDVYPKMMLRSIERLVKIHCVVLSNNALVKSYVGHYGELKKECREPIMALSLAKNGKMQRIS